MVSKELLSEVFGVDIKDDPKIGFAYDDYNGVELEWQEVRFNFISYPLDYVANKCKEWALKHNYGIASSTDGYVDSVINGFSGIYVMQNPNEILNEFQADTEPEAIFKACQWILDNINKKEAFYGSEQ